MAYRIRCRMPLDQELKRVFSEQLDDFILWMGNPEQDLVPSASSPVVNLLQSHYNGVQNKLMDQKVFFALSCLELQDSKEQIKEIELDSCTEYIRKGLKRVYRRGRKAIQKEKKHPDTRN